MTTFSGHNLPQLQMSIVVGPSFLGGIPWRLPDKLEGETNESTVR